MNRPSRQQGGQSGMVLVAAMLVLALLSVLCIAGISSSTLEVKISAHDRNAKQAFYLCEAGLERARYELVKGWGTGQSTATSSPYDFAFDATTLPAPLLMPAGSIGWRANQWRNFTLVDKAGQGFLVVTNSAGGGTSYTIDQCTGTAPPEPGRASLFYRDTWLRKPVSSVTSTNAYFGEDWTGFFLVDDSTGAVFDIAGNTADTLTLSGTPGTGPYRIVSSKLWVSGSIAHVTLAPGVPNPLWTATPALFLGGGWHLIDERTPSHAYRITAAGPSTYGGVDLTLSRIPQASTFHDVQLTASPWLVDTAATPVTWTAGDSTTAFPTPSGTGYGSVTLSVVPDLADTYKLRADSASVAAAGDAKELELKVELQRTGAVLLRDWRQLK